MRYHINFDRSINQLVPHYIGGRKLILYLQALMKPLQQLNNAFVEYAKEQRIEASVTSQVGWFEWFLNHKLGKYFANPDDSIVIANGEQLGVPIYLESANIPKSDHMRLYNQSEKQGLVLYLKNDNTTTSSHSFIVHAPAINTGKITKESYLAMLKYYIDKYRLGGKTYKINYNE